MSHSRFIELNITDIVSGNKYDLSSYNTSFINGIVGNALKFNENNNACQPFSKKSLNFF